MSQGLAEIYQSAWVPEFAREYLQKLDRPYERKDLRIIGKGQLMEEEKKEDQANRVLFCDTDMLVLKVWSEFKYGTCDDWISRKVQKHRYDLYLLCDIDLEWKEDPLREHPDKREDLFNLYIRELDSLEVRYRIISGQGKDRLRNAVAAVSQELGIDP